LAIFYAVCFYEICTKAIAHIKNKKAVQTPISDDGVIVDRVWVKKSEVHNWLKEKEKKGYVLTAQALASLFFLYE
jgi:hypothetical protein